MKKFILASLLIQLVYGRTSAGTFVSAGAGPANWNTPASWIFSNDADGIPDSDDTITIAVGHNIFVSTNPCQTRYLTVNGTLDVRSTGYLYIYRDYIVNGTETGSGYVTFIGNPSATISGGGIFGTNTRYSFSVSKTINPGVLINKSNTVNTSIGSNVTVTNLGEFRLGLVNASTNARLVNGATGTLVIKRYAFNFSTIILDCTTSGNTINYNFSDANYTLISPVANTYSNVIISGSTTKNLPANTTINGNLTIQPSCGFNMNGFNVNLRGNFSNNSNLFTQTAGTIFTLDGTSAQNITCTNTFSTNFTNLTINNSAGVTCTSGLITISEVLNVLGGNFNLGSNFITLRSTPASTARIGQVSGSLSGSMIIQRHVDARADGYSSMSSSVSVATFAQWADNFPMIFGAYVPGSFIPSAWSYSETAWDFAGVTSSGQSINAGEGYEVFLDNDGSTSTPWSATTLDLNGTPNFGNVTFTATRNNDGWNLAGNPYASFIDWDAFRAGNGVPVNASWMYYDETISDYASAGAGSTIAPSQGMWIECTAPGTVTFQESFKTTSNSSTFRNQKENLFGIRLASEMFSFTSNTYFRFDDYATRAYEANHDLTFLKVPHPDAPALYTLSSDGKRLRINELKADDDIVMPLEFQIGKSGYYMISANDLGSAEDNGYTCFFLEDTRTHQTFDLTSGSYHFYADINEKGNRFVLRLSKNSNNCRMSQDAIVLNTEPEGVSIVNSQNGLFVNFEMNELSNAVITVINPLGQNIINPISAQVKQQNVRVYLPADYTGIYLINVQVGDQLISRKYFK